MVSSSSAIFASLFVGSAGIPLVHNLESTHPGHSLVPPDGIAPPQWAQAMSFPVPAAQLWDFMKPWDAPYVGEHTEFRITSINGSGVGSARFISNADNTFNFFETLEEFDEETMTVAYRFHEAAPFVGGGRFSIDSTSDSSCIVVWTGNPDAGDHLEEMRVGHPEFLRTVLTGLRGTFDSAAAPESVRSFLFLLISVVPLLSSFITA